MTKREWDKATKWNYGTRMEGDIWRDYQRITRQRLDLGRDFIADRAWEMARTNRYAGSNGFVATLAVASKYRAPATYRARTGRPMLGA